MSTLVDDISLSEKAAIRRKWRLEKERWELDKVRHQDEVNVWERERRERKEEREKYARDKEEWERQQREEREAYEREKEEWARQRREEENHRKEMEWKRKGAHWSEPSGSTKCIAYGTRAYTAKLLNLPMDLDPIQACLDMPVKFHGHWLESPAQCEIKVSHCHSHLSQLLFAKFISKDGETWATWFIGFDESQCITYWDTLHDKVSFPS